MIENLDLSLVDWSRAQFALTAIYHWFFVPLTLGLSFIIAIMETLYVKTGREEWKRATKFWMTLFGINFAIGVATGIILEFEFGTNWSNYSWFVGDIFGAPLAIEGILAFFLESTFVAVMFFGWNKVSRRFHLISTWLVAIGANLSALWILVANAWMQNPVGMVFNPETARNEMVDFWAILFNPVAVDKFMHTITSGFLLASIFVIGVSSWYLIKKREEWLAKRSILIAGIFGFLSSLAVALTGDSSARTLAKVQPVKFAAFEALYEGKSNAGLVAIGLLKKSDETIGEKKVRDFVMKIEIPGFLSVMTGGDKDTYVPGIKDLVLGSSQDRQFISVEQKMIRGRYARDLLNEYKEAKKNNNHARADEIKNIFSGKDFINDYFSYFGYAFLKSPEDAIPNVPVAFYSFHLMVMLGFFFIALCALSVFLVLRDNLHKNRWFLWVALLSIPLVYLTSELGWVLAEMGRQPWIIQDLMPVSAAVSQIKAGSVITTFILFAVLFTALLTAEVSIMLKQIKSGPKHQEEIK
ncbi:MAG TPA: cytochrome ubiquinol oxidase subunit I [Bacteroidales bacterium]|jgi:cytochrome d ubiquinol oxidase subunit I|nr:MAG: Cytochrome bd-I ubiquinol oxidase subunit 1 [Bacteroidetes bacterium ADurb.Bin145]HOU02241.1 cytochrome ubiquinol oxidase subunit I [Bacteroidales bacterium]HQG62238.1 cytochrome ubiquinol oxidase subunit I [Bacteroidales bacterium]HQK68599.1 cytochrome ubiquinol oxidase subunit I [Bacteroidales bacterium]